MFWSKRRKERLLRDYSDNIPAWTLNGLNFFLPYDDVGHLCFCILLLIYWSREVTITPRFALIYLFKNKTAAVFRPEAFALAAHLITNEPEHALISVLLHETDLAAS